MSEPFPLNARPLIPDPATICQPAPGPFLTDPISWLFWFARSTLNMLWCVASFPVSLLQQLGVWLLDMWVFMWPAFVSIFSWSADQAGKAFLLLGHVYFDLVLQVHVWLRDFWVSLENYLAYVLQAWLINYGALLRVLLAPAVSILYDVAAPLLLLHDAFAAVKGKALGVAAAAEQLALEVEIRVGQAFGLVRERIDSTISWVNHSHHELGVFREDPFYWTLYYMIGDLWGLLVNVILSDTLAADTAALKGKYPVETFGLVTQRYLAGQYAQRPELVAAVQAFLGGKVGK